MHDEPGVVWAAGEAERLLGPLRNRWAHTRAVADTARWLAGIDEAVDSSVLVAAAYVHDIGYAPLMHDTGHHAIDGARHLASQGHWRLSSLVANPGAAHEAALLGLAAHLDTFPPEVSPTADALTYCDVLMGAAGERVTLQERFADVRRRYGDSHVVTLAMERAYGELERAVDAVEARVSTLRR